MTILRGGGGSTNITYVAISAARQKPRIQTQTTSACFPWLRDLGGATLGGDEEGTTQPLECGCVHGRPVGRTRGTERCRCVGMYHPNSEIDRAPMCWANGDFFCDTSE